jgi:hypothetical protein
LSIIRDVKVCWILWLQIVSCKMIQGVVFCIRSRSIPHHKKIQGLPQKGVPCTPSSLVITMVLVLITGSSLDQSICRAFQTYHIYIVQCCKKVNKWTQYWLVTVTKSLNPFSRCWLISWHHTTIHTLPFSMPVLTAQIKTPG